LLTKPKPKYRFLVNNSNFFVEIYLYCMALSLCLLTKFRNGEN